MTAEPPEVTGTVIRLGDLASIEVLVAYLIGASKVTRLGETTFGQWLRERETHIAVVGRCWGEDDDCPMLFNNTTIEQAKEEFRLELGQVDDIKDLPEDGPGSVIITSVLLSFSPIFDVEA